MKNNIRHMSLSPPPPPPTNPARAITRIMKFIITQSQVRREHTPCDLT